MADRSDRRRSTLPGSPSSKTAESEREAKGLKYSEIHEICACGDSDKLEELLKAGRHEFVNYKDPDWEERTPLHWCSLKGKGDMVRRLLDKGAHPGLRSSCGWTAAHFAAEAGKTSVLRALHSMNSPMNRRDIFGDTPKRIAEIYGHKEAVEFLSLAGEEYRQRRMKTELSGEAEPYDDEDMEWCVRNSFQPDAYISQEDLDAASLSLKSFADSVTSSKRSGRKAKHYGRNFNEAKSSKSPTAGRRRSNDSSPADKDKKAGKRPNRKKSKSPQSKKTLDRISEVKSP